MTIILLVNHDLWDTIDCLGVEYKNILSLSMDEREIFVRGGGQMIKFAKFA